jgi:hypothetical protein
MDNNQENLLNGFTSPQQPGRVGFTSPLRPQNGRAAAIGTSPLDRKSRPVTVKISPFPLGVKDGPQWGECDRVFTMCISLEPSHRPLLQKCERMLNAPESAAEASAVPASSCALAPASLAPGSSASAAPANSVALLTEDGATGRRLRARTLLAGNR